MKASADNTLDAKDCARQTSNAQSEIDISRIGAQQRESALVGFQASDDGQKWQKANLTYQKKGTHKKAIFTILHIDLVSDVSANIHSGCFAVNRVGKAPNTLNIFNTCSASLVRVHASWPLLPNFSGMMAWANEARARYARFMYAGFSGA